ncbi:MAG: hypothetical protein KAW47_08635 [Thermoplasmatales archaeon]|nr:hypothetical protein [Thermoplasmatales archaeon]
MGNELGFDRAETDRISQYLVGEYLMEYAAQGGIIAITHQGVIEVEDALSNPEEPTQYFPPVNIINIHHMQNSQIQQGTVESTQSQHIELKTKNDIFEFVELVKSKLPDLSLNAEDMAEIEADINTVQSQISSSRPKKSILRECLSSMQRLLEGIAGSVVAQQLIPLIPPLIASL